MYNVRTYPARNPTSTSPWRVGETDNDDEWKRLIEVNNQNSIANITIYTNYLYYWRKCNILFVAQMKYGLWQKWKIFLAQNKYQLAQKQCVAIIIWFHRPVLSYNKRQSRTGQVCSHIIFISFFVKTNMAPQRLLND